MAATAREILDSLRDPSRYAQYPDEDLFTEREEDYWETVRDRDGRPVRGKDGKAKRVKKRRVFNKDFLERIAANTNRRNAQGALAAISLGHTLADDDESEVRQPDLIGGCTRLKVRFDPDKGKHTLYGDLHFRRDRLGDLKGQIWRKSVELWPGRTPEDPHGWFIDPVAIIKRTPEVDLKPLFFRNNRPVLRYAAGDWNPDEETDMPGEHDEPGQIDVQEEPGGGEDVEITPEEKEQYERHCFSHPHAAKYHKSMCAKYAMADEEPPPEEEHEPPAPTEPPDADEEPGQYGHDDDPDRYGAVASATNSGDGMTPRRHSRTGQVGRSPKRPPQPRGGVDRYRKGGEDTTRRRIEELEQREATRVGENWVLRLSDQEGYDLDEQAEVARFAKAYRVGGDAACEKRADEVRRYHRTKIDHPERVRVADSPPPQRGGGRVPTIEELAENPESLPPEDMPAVERYQRKHNLWDSPLHELAERALPHKYHRAARNGSAK